MGQMSGIHDLNNSGRFVFVDLLPTFSLTPTWPNQVQAMMHGHGELVPIGLTD